MQTNLKAWLDDCETHLVHPDVLQAQLRRNGWDPIGAARVADEYRGRFDEHPLGYSALLVSTGVAALALGTAGHLLTSGLTGPVDRNALAAWLTILLCTLPFAGWAHDWARRVDREDAVAVWSRPRRNLALTLLWACGTVGGIHLLMYGRQLVGSLVGASWAGHDSLGAGAVNVGITLSIALPLGAWAWRFLHRFDREDPTAVPGVRPRPVAA